MTHETAIKIGRGPWCPACGEDRFDDWWLHGRLRAGDGIVVSLSGSVQCHGCGKHFHIEQYVDGVTHSTMKRRVKTSQIERDKP